MHIVTRGRFAPSPSGEMHLGNAWTALLAWLQTRSLGGQMILRMEDLDPDRSKKAFAQQLIEDLRWLGLDWDEGPDLGGPYEPYNQDGRRSSYEEALQKLTAAGLLYACYCTRAELRSVAQAPHAGEINVYSGTCRFRATAGGEDVNKRQTSLRLAVPPIMIEFIDLCQGEYRQDMTVDAGDFIVRRADGIHAYQLAVVVDDAAMQITHVLRGADLLDSTPRQLLLFELLGLKKPCYSHVPLLIGSDGERLSKRHGDVSLAALRAKGVPAEIIVGYLAFKANLIKEWVPVRPQQLVELFQLAKLPRESVVIDIEEFYKC